MWSIERPAMMEWGAGRVVPKHVLYYYDGPTIFTANVGLTEFLFFKVDEYENSDLFLVAPTDERITAALREKTLSIRGALAGAKDYWLLNISPAKEVIRYWKVSSEDFVPDWLPANGLAISPLQSPAADFVEQAQSFFSARFTGGDLTENRIPFSRFKTLVDAAYDSFRRIFPPPVIDSKSLGRSLEFDILQPKFSSLIIAIDRPSVDVADARKYVGSNIDRTLIANTFDSNRKDFFDRMDDLLDEARKGEIKKSSAIEHFYTLAQVNEIIPTSNNELDRVEFRSQAPNLKPAIVDDQLGNKFRSAFKVAESAPRQVVGVIIDINEASGTMVLRDVAARQVTCVFDRSTYENLDVAIGDKLKVRGDFSRRRRRDKIVVTSTPELLK